MNNKQHYLTDPLWQRIDAYSIDSMHAERPLSVKLAEEQGWLPTYTRRVLQEYKRFIYLCCTSPKGASPSYIVDEAWHTHLTYTHSYWQDFCRDTLGQDVHHYPSAGGVDELARHDDWYRETLMAYADTFGEPAPDDIWPATNRKPKQMDSSVLEATLATPYNKRLFFWLLLPIVLITVLYGQPVPFLLSGPHFLVFFTGLVIATTVMQVLHNTARKQQMIQTVETEYGKPSPEEQAWLAGGDNRLALYLIVELLETGALEYAGYDDYKWTGAATANRLGVLLNDRYAEQAILKEQELKELAQQAAAGVYIRQRSVQQAYDTGRPIMLWLVPLVIGVARMVQGLGNSKPVAFLVMELVSLGMAGMIVYMNYGFYLVWSRYFKQMVTDVYGQEVPVALRVAALGVVVLAAYPGYAQLNRSFSDAGITSGDSSGGGCSGGGGCGGGGCGGCGGS